MGDTIWTEDASILCTSSCYTIPRPDLYSCHRCGLRFPVNGGIDRFHILESQWRIVLLCYDCLDGVRTGKACSYCFLGFSELEEVILVCSICSCRVHRSCVPLHHRNLWSSQLDTGKFVCVDCCPVQRFRGKDFIKSGDPAARSGFSFLLEEKPILEKKVTKEGRVMVTRGSAEIMQKAHGSVHLDHTHINLIVSDEELALRLHRSVNGSQRISRSLCPKDETRLAVARKVRGCNHSVGKVVDSNHCDHNNKVRVCSENTPLLVSRESSQSIITSSIYERKDEDLTKKITIYNTEGPTNFSLKEKEISLNSSDSTTDDCIGSVLISRNSSNSQLSNAKALNEYRFGVGEVLSELHQKTIDAPSADRYKKKYFRRRWSSKKMTAELP